MFSDGITPAVRRAYYAALAADHHRQFRIQVIGLDHQPIDDITESLIDGEVVVDWDGEEATRAATIALLDPNYTLGFDAPSSDDGVWFMDRMVQVVSQVWVDRTLGFVEVPIFTGPIRKFKRSGDIVTLSCVGKDLFVRRAWRRVVIPKGTRVVEAIRNVLEAMGESHFRFEADSTAKFPGVQTVDRNLQASPFGWCRQHATALGFKLFYDGAGYATLRVNRPDQPVFTFSDGDGGMVLTDPEAEGDFTNIANVIRAEGMVQGGGANPYYEAFVDESSPIHPSKLRRNGVPMYFGRVIQRDSIRDTRQAKAAAEQELAASQAAIFDVAFDALPLYVLEENDACRVLVDGKASTFVARKFQFGFTADAVMPIGYRKSVSPRLAKIRRM